MDILSLVQTPLFAGTAPNVLPGMLQCLGAYQKQYSRGETILHAGQCTQHMGLVLSGSVQIEMNDLWGNRSILSRMQSGQSFAETFACLPDEPMLVSAAACEPSEILFLNVSRMLSPCTHTCAHHAQLILNLLRITAQQNLMLSRRSLHTTPKTIRGRLLSYLSEQTLRNGSRTFSISFSRQQLADYLGVDRSALSAELSKMRQEGLISCRKNEFVILQGVLPQER